MKKRFLLIDSENVQNRLFEILESARKRDKVIVFYTVYHSGKLEEYLRSNKNRKNIEFVECIAGNNALDLQLMGVLAFLIHRHPKREFIVYSNDKGYKALVKHWQSKNVDVELVNFLTPAVGEDAYEFKSPITVETAGSKRGRKSRVSFSSAGKSISRKKEDKGTAVVEKTFIRREPSKPAPSEKPAQPPKAALKQETRPAEKTAPVKETKPAEQKTEHSVKKPSEQMPVIQEKPAPVQPAPEAKSRPRVVVDALLIPSQTESKPEQKAKVNNVVTAPEPKHEAPAAAEPAQTEAAQTAAEEKTEAPVKKKRGRKSKAEKAAEEAAKAALAAQQEAETAEKPAEEPQPEKKKRGGRRKKAEEKAEDAPAQAETVQTEQAEETQPETAVQPEPAEEAQTEQEKTAKPEPMTDEEFVSEICRSVRSTDLALINRILTVGFGSEAAKGYYARFKSDPDYREEMGRLYNYSKNERIHLLIRTALRKGGISPERADNICRILSEKGTANMQALYHSFIKELPGNVADRQSAYKAVKPYLPITDSL